MTRTDVTVDLDDVEATARIAKVGNGNYVSWHLTLNWGSGEITFDASTSDDLESLLDSMQHDLMLLKAGAA